METNIISKEEDKKKVFRTRPKVKIFNPHMDKYKIPIETEEYQFIVLTQLVTSHSKQDVYFAKDTNNKLVVVKGPYPSLTPIEILKRHTEWKKQNHLPYIPFEIKEMIPDRWPEGIAMGIRNSLDRTKTAWFIIFDSVIEENQIKIKKHQSKCWSETEVVDWSTIPLHFDYTQSLTSQEMTDYVHGLLFRYLYGVSDLADRNFLKVKGRIISIDEDIENKNVNLYSELKRNKSEYIQNWLETNYHRLDVLQWPETDSRIKNQRLKEIQNREKCINLFC
jgi:hypothetical protein